ncbi:High-affinity branched-chain amino acid transport ATP-binding protein LivF [wastewater metagenome]|uniref:High-affinity branched-chain amino acid transport ATP-binding protein LivF n=2 Tax=unclassified sequences TaxID=12908 RepID=A0A5B8RCU8_9ZZZZ|nr:MULTISPECIES: ABC transporter ATP-binding protein [Arhodomonas]MCS4505502.1 ABC transporter ATP-binding protein [Arhodomonas aquaeolei]QEA05758.1 high-affinity branched-chain amino acid transport ATP-binding protein LivF [uncultured organism]
MPLLKAEGVTAGYGDTEILRDVHLEVGEGEIVSLIGPNGAGKSTLMKTVFGLVHPRQGSIRFRDTEIAGRSPYDIVKEGMCYVPQVANVFVQLTVEENLEMGGYLLEERELAGRKEQVYELFPKLRERRRQRAGKMSGGERQMVAIGSALMLEPALLLLDEPSAGLSPKLVDEIFENIRRINATGLAVLMVEQNARKSLEMAERGYVLAGGQNRVEGSGAELLNDPDVARLYLGG